MRPVLRRAPRPPRVAYLELTSAKKEKNEVRFDVLWIMVVVILREQRKKLTRPRRDPRVNLASLDKHIKQRSNQCQSSQIHLLLRYE